MATDRCQVPGQQLHFRVRWYVSTAQEVRSRGSRQRRGWRRIRASKLSGRNPHSPPRCDAWPVCRADRRHIETKRTIPVLPEEKAQYLLPQGVAELENGQRFVKPDRIDDGIEHASPPVVSRGVRQIAFFQKDDIRSRLEVSLDRASDHLSRKLEAAFLRWPLLQLCRQRVGTGDDDHQRRVVPEHHSQTPQYFNGDGKQAHLQDSAGHFDSSSQIFDRFRVPASLRRAAVIFSLTFRAERFRLERRIAITRQAVDAESPANLPQRIRNSCR